LLHAFAGTCMSEVYSNGTHLLYMPVLSLHTLHLELHSPSSLACPAGSKLSQQYTLSPVLTQLQSMLDQLYRLVDDTPPVQQSLRYGNPAFRTWYATMTEMTPGMLQQVRSGVLRLGDQTANTASFNQLSISGAWHAAAGRGRSIGGCCRFGWQQLCVLALRRSHKHSRQPCTDPSYTPKK
jgi:hypothetical protein